MTTVDVRIVDAFTREGRGGNPAGVVVDAEALSTEQMQQVATAVGLSETAFVLPSGEADQRLRYFTPRSEVALCGHATVASYHLLRERGRVQPGLYELETAAGRQSVRCAADGTVAMSQNLPELGGEVPADQVASVLGISPGQLGPPSLLPPQVASTGLHKIFVPMPTPKAVDALVPDREGVHKLSIAHGAIGIYAYAVGGAVTAYCRNFAPVVGIWDDAATGTSAAALACLLQERGNLDPRSCGELVFHQGDVVDRPSEIRVALSLQGRHVAGIEVMGKATLGPRETIRLT